MFPVSGINFLGNGLEAIKGMWFTDAADLILNLVGKTRIEVVRKAPSPYPWTWDAIRLKLPT